MTRRFAARLAAAAIAVAAGAAPGCDRIVELTPVRDAAPLNDGDSLGDGGPLPDANTEDAAPAPDAFATATTTGTVAAVPAAR